MMAAVRAKDTNPELVVRRGLHQRGFRFLLHDKRLPGRPDMVLPKWKAAIFVHGCFWHGHDCPLFRLPKTRSEFWRPKIDRNRERDTQALTNLNANGWRALVIWECAFKGPSRIGIDQTLELADKWIRSNQESGVIRGL